MNAYLFCAVWMIAFALMFMVMAALDHEKGVPTEWWVNFLGALIVSFVVVGFSTFVLWLFEKGLSE